MKKKRTELKELWQQRVEEQEKSGQSVRAFCRERGIGEHSFYQWRVRLRASERPVTFALVETGRVDRDSSDETHSRLELLLGGGERLRISVGVDLSLLRSVLEVLRA